MQECCILLETSGLTFHWWLRSICIFANILIVCSWVLCEEHTPWLVQVTFEPMVRANSTAGGALERDVAVFLRAVADAADLPQRLLAARAAPEAGEGGAGGGLAEEAEAGVLAHVAEVHLAASVAQPPPVEALGVVLEAAAGGEPLAQAHHAHAVPGLVTSAPAAAQVEVAQTPRPVGLQRLAHQVVAPVVTPH